MGYKYPSLRTTLPIAGYYARLDSGAAATDQFTADGAQDGTLINGATRVDDNGLAYSFDGVNDYLTIPFAAFPGAYPFSISCWFNVPNVTDAFYLLSINDINSSDAYFALAAAGTLTGDPVVVLAGDAGGTSFAQSSAGFTANTWHHVLAVFTSVSSRTVYLNGGSSGTETTARSPNLALLDNIAVGALRRSSVIHSQCLIDDIAIYPIALNATQAGYLASQRGVIYVLAASGGSPINGQSLIRPADSKPYQQLIGV